jgi:hypothetical protein
MSSISISSKFTHTPPFKVLLICYSSFFHNFFILYNLTCCIHEIILAVIRDLNSSVYYFVGH